MIQLGDLHSFIADREIEILHGLQEAVLQSGDMLISAANLCAELDW